MFGFHFPDDINDSSLLLFDSLWRVKVNYMYRKIIITSFTFLSKKFQAAGDSFYLETVSSVGIFSEIICN